MASEPTRDAYGRALARLGKTRGDIVVLDADISKSTKTCYFAGEFPERFFNVGIAEQNMLGIAAGLATMGKIPFVSTYAVFAAMRACEQIRTSICYPCLNVKIAASHGGLTPGNDGATHQGTEDMGILRTIPNMTIVMPADRFATEKLVERVVDYKGPVYLRLTRDPVPDVYSGAEDFEIGRAKLVLEGSDVTIIAIGDMLITALNAAWILRGRGVGAEVIDMHTLKPLDVRTLGESLGKTGAAVTVEDHNILNGLGSAVAEYICENEPMPLIRIGVNDTFAESGEYRELVKKYHMSEDDVAAAAMRAISMKRDRFRACLKNLRVE
jgi:transketolase